MAARYEFRVCGLLSERTRLVVGDFSEVRIVAAPPETVIYGVVTDRSHLHGFLALLDNLGLQIVSLRQVPDDET